MIWKALADPTRRTILDLLHVAPHTTGELSDQIDNLSRYAVMKHLGILEKANLITTRKEGKFRWNHLNTLPIKESYEQWLGQLLQIKKFAAPATESMGSTEQTVRTSTLSLEVSLRASRAQVWKALTKDIGQWWPKSFYIGNSDGEMVLQAQPGGLWYEDAGEAGGQVWGTVIGMEKGQSLLLKGHLSPALGGPAISFLHFALQAKGRQIILQFSDTIFGEISAEVNSSLQKDWENLLQQELKTYLNRRSEQEK